MESQKEYTQTDLETAKKVVSIDVNLNNLSGQFITLQQDMKDGFAELNKSIPGMRVDLNQTMTLATENKLERIRTETESKARDTVLEGRIKNLEDVSKNQNSERNGEKHLYRSIFAIIGGVTAIGGLIIMIITVIQKLQGIRTII